MQQAAKCESGLGATTEMPGLVLLQCLLARSSVWECDIRVNMCAALRRKCEFAVKVGVVFIYLFIIYLQTGVGEEV